MPVTNTTVWFNDSKSRSERKGNEDKREKGKDFLILRERRKLEKRDISQKLVCHIFGCCRKG